MSRNRTASLLVSTAVVLLLPSAPALAGNTDWLNADWLGGTQVAQTPPPANDQAPDTQQPQQQPVVLQPLTVTGTKDPTPQDQVPATIDVIGPEKIERKQALTVGDLLQTLPGVEVEGGPKGSQSQPNIRGFGGTGWGTNRVVTLLDGARQDVGAAHGGSMFYDPELLKQVEVLKGTGSTLYGSGAIGGVISMTTKSAEDFLDGDDRYGFRVKGGFHSVNNEPMTSETLAVRPIDGLDFLGNFTWRESGDYRNGSGDRIDNTTVDSKNGLMKLGIEPGEGQRVELSGIIYADDEGITATDVDNGNAEYQADHHIRKTTASAHYTFDSPKTDLINLSATAYRDATTVADYGGDYPRDTKAELTTTGLDLFNTFKFKTAWADHAVTLGTEYYHDAGKGRVNGDPESQNPDATQDVVGIYSQYRVTLLDRLSITPGLRWDYYRTDPEGDFPSKKNNRVTPKVGVDWQATDFLSLYGSYSQGYRAPSIRELYISGTHFNIFPGANNVFVTNPDLKPETTRTWEGGLRLDFEDVVMTGDNLRFTGSYFDTRARNFIDGDVVMDFATFTFTTTPINVPRAHIRGAEIGLSYDSDYVFLDGGWSRIRGDNTTDNEPLTSIPADKFVATVGGKVPAIDVSFGVTDEYAWNQHRVDDQTLWSDHFNIVGLFASWAPDQGVLKGVRLDAGIDNLFDKDYQRFLAFVDAPGRDYHIALSYGASF